jgi:hypothetical protein
VLFFLSFLIVLLRDRPGARRTPACTGTDLMLATAAGRPALAKIEAEPRQRR